MVRDRFPRGCRPRTGRVYRNDLTWGEVSFWLQFSCYHFIVGEMIHMVEMHIRRMGSEDIRYSLFICWSGSFYTTSLMWLKLG